MSCNAVKVKMSLAYFLVLDILMLEWQAWASLLDEYTSSTYIKSIRVEYRVGKFVLDFNRCFVRNLGLGTLSETQFTWLTRLTRLYLKNSSCRVILHYSNSEKSSTDYSTAKKTYSWLRSRSWGETFCLWKQRLKPFSLKWIISRVLFTSEQLVLAGFMLLEDVSLLVLLKLVLNFE